jgi:membrane-bound lytic murein transglycosylase D
MSVGFVLASCSPRLQQQPPRTTPAPVAVPTPPPAPVAPPADPVAVLIASSQQHFDAGQREARLGHLDRARAEFNLAVGVLLNSPYGARTDTRLREQFDRLVDRISTAEISALSQGDAFTEKQYEPASIDQLLELSTFERANPSAGLQERVQADLASTSHDIPIPLNAQVLKYIDLFQGRLRDWVRAGLSRGARYLPMIQNVFRAEGLPLDLAYVPLIESAFNPNAVSRAKAKGVWQFMQGTALEHGLRQDWYVDERADPAKATSAAAKYLKTLCGLFSGDWHLALASYNGGPGLVQRALTRSRMSDYWALVENSKLLPRETREYVPMILAAIVIARNPSQYGFDLTPEAPPAYDEVTITKPVDLRRVAEWSGASLAEIQALNPELRQLVTPLKSRESDQYRLRVPSGTGAALEERFAQADPKDLVTLNWYTVRRGDSLATIANRNGVTRANLAAANYLSVKSPVKPGQSLVIPREATVLLAARADRPQPQPSSRAVATAGAMLTEGPSVAPKEAFRTVYLVKSGDTLFSVARLFNTSVDALKLWNHLRSSAIHVGDRLTVFTKRPPATSAHVR